MKQIQEMAKALGLSGDGALPQMPQAPQETESGLSIDPAGLFQLQSLLRQAKSDDPGSAFLRSLRPLLKTERQKKIDEAIRILHLLNLLPALRQSGLLKNMLGSLE